MNQEKLCYLAADNRPDAGEDVVEAYGPTLADRYKTGTWVTWGSRHLEDWHIWRSIRFPDFRDLKQARDVRIRDGVRTLKANGFYVRATS